MPVNRDFLGREFPASAIYEVAREKIRDFAVAIGDLHPVYLDPAAARVAGYRDVLAPPTFLTVLGFRFGPDSPIADPDFGLDFTLVVHGEQRFVLHRPVCAGDRLISTQIVEEIRDVGRNEVVLFRTEVSTEAGEKVATIHAGMVSRGTSAKAATR